MSAVDTPASGLSAHVPEVTNVLLVAEPDDDRADQGCMELLTCTPPPHANVLCMTALGTPDDAVEAWEHHADRPARLGVIDIGGRTRSSRDGVGDPTDPFSILPVDHPGDLIGIEITRSRYQSAWADDGNRLVVCVDSLNPILEQVSLERAFRFLNALTGQFRAADGVAHFHIDPSSVDERALNTLKGLFDAVAEPDPDGGWQVGMR